MEADRADEALTYIEFGEQVDLVFSDIQTPGSLDGLNWLKHFGVNIPTFR